jgi:S1-C subfamily serine protease
MSRRVPARVPFFLFFLFFAGLALNLLAFVDLRWTHWLLVRANPDSATAEPVSEVLDDTRIEQLRQSILNVRIAQCGADGENVGTGFVVKTGYVATAAHVLGDQQACNGRIRLIDFKGREHSAALDGLSAQDDLALLRISDSSLPPLRLADSSLYERPSQVVRLVTIGYPLEDAGASARDNAAISNEGILSRYNPEQNVFVTSGLNLNPGNSGGPIFMPNNWQVLGIARAKLANEVGDGIGYVAPIRTFKNFFREKTGQELP